MYVRKCSDCQQKPKHGRSYRCTKCQAKRRRSKQSQAQRARRANLRAERERQRAELSDRVRSSVETMRGFVDRLEADGKKGVTNKSFRDWLDELEGLLE